MQSRHLALSPGHLNRTEWTEHFITRVLTVTHSQWVYRNVSFHDKQHGHAKRKRVEELNHTIRHMCDVNPRDLPQDSRFLLEIDGNDMSKESMLKKEYWVETMEAAVKAGMRKAMMGRRARRSKQKAARVIKRNEHLGVFAVEREIREDTAMVGQITTLMLNRVRRGARKRGATAMGVMGPNKR